MTTSIRSILTIARTTLAEAIRDRILYGLLLFAGALLLLAAVLSNVTLGWSVRIVTNLSFSAISGIGAIMAILFGVRSISQDVDRRTCYPLLAKPIERSHYLLGKFLGVLLTVYLNVALMTAAATLLIAVFSHVRPFQYELAAYLLTVVLTFVRLAVLAGIAVAFSALSSPTVALIASGGIGIAGYFTSEVRFFLSKSDLPSTRVLGDVLYYLLPDFAVLDALPRLLHEHPVVTTSTLAACAYAAFYIATVLTVANVIFSKRDLA